MIIGMHHVTNAVVATGHKWEWFHPSGEDQLYIAVRCSPSTAADVANSLMAWASALTNEKSKRAMVALLENTCTEQRGENMFLFWRC